MKQNLLLIILISIVSHVFASSKIRSNQDMEEEDLFLPEWVIRFFSPEGAIMLDSMTPRKPRNEHFGTAADFFVGSSSENHRDHVHMRLNSLDLNDTESESEAEKLVRDKKVNDKLYFFFRGYYCISDLNEELFKAAIETGDVERLRNILAKKKHLLLTSEQKVRVFLFALSICDNDFYFPEVVFAGFGEIFRMLLKAKFYPKNGIWPETDTTVHPLMAVLRDPLLYQPFLDYDADIFAKERKVNFVALCARSSEYVKATKALELGFNPKIDEGTGRNALDYVLDDPFCELSEEEAESRQELSRIFQEEYDMEPSNTIENFEYVCEECEVNGDWRRAIELVRLGGMKCHNRSPIAVAFCFENAALINAAIDWYIDDLSKVQLISILSELDLGSIEDENQQILLYMAAERLMILKNIVLDKK